MDGAHFTATMWRDHKENKYKSRDVELEVGVPVHKYMYMNLVNT